MVVQVGNNWNYGSFGHECWSSSIEKIWNLIIDEKDRWPATAVQETKNWNFGSFANESWRASIVIIWTHERSCL